LIAAPNIRFRDVVTSGQNTIGDTVQIGFDSLCANVNEDNLESEGARIEHHAQIVLSRKRRLDGKVLAVA